jgi:hypothetical protein
METRIVPKSINKPMVMPKIPPTGNTDGGVMAFTVVPNLVVIMKATVVCFVVVVGSVVEIACTVGI